MIRIDGQTGYLFDRNQANEVLIRSHLLKSAYSEIKEWQGYYTEMNAALNSERLAHQSTARALGASEEISESLKLQLKASKKKAPKRLVQGLVVGAVVGFVGAVVIR